MTLYMLGEEERQVVILALVELKRRRPGWDEWLSDLIDGILSGRQMRVELERLHDELGWAYSHTTAQRIEALEVTTHNLSVAVAQLEIGRARDGLDAVRHGSDDAEPEAEDGR